LKVILQAVWSRAKAVMYTTNAALHSIQSRLAVMRVHLHFAAIEFAWEIKTWVPMKPGLSLMDVSGV